MPPFIERKKHMEKERDRMHPLDFEEETEMATTPI